jgi:hypothetical protein
MDSLSANDKSPEGSEFLHSQRPTTSCPSPVPGEGAPELWLPVSTDPVWQGPGGSVVTSREHGFGTGLADTQKT